MNKSSIIYKENVPYKIPSVMCPDSKRRMMYIAGEERENGEIPVNTSAYGFKISGVVREKEGEYIFIPHPWGRNADILQGIHV